ncbi:DUF4129 domain-containing protein [Nocardia bovistercoris]|uniref:DUF4129 domain-containing protein n=1 Tax=Nocardia bovistercoris TaxID=2785916 RepID=A0A931N8A4_9NOCA|nr:DUF4129 domain-containing protein [Nocardia bovistercoris]MBH0781568.1 DUF4129 domain-containing protein [Nocardia bovistercoris]
MSRVEKGRALWRRSIRAAALLSTVLVLVLGLRGPISETSDDIPNSATAQSILPLAVLAAIAVVIIGLSVSSFAGNRERVAVAEQRRRTPRSRLPFRRIIVLATVVLVATAAVATMSLLLPGAPVEQRVDQGADSTQSPSGSNSPPPQQESRQPLDNSALRALGAVAAVTMLAALVGAGSVVIRSGRRAGTAPEDTARTEERLAHAAHRAQTEIIDRRQDPRAAVLACYRAMEQEFSALPALSPRASDTPSEVLARAVGIGIVGGDTAARLVALFAEARFSTHPMTEAHRAAAGNLLDAVLDGLEPVR